MIKRSPLIYYGGKFRCAEQIIRFFPAHNTYIEPFGGGAGVLLHKIRSNVEIYNDIDATIVNFWRVLRDNADELIRKIQLTPYSRDEFELSCTPSDDPIEQARRTVVVSQMSFNGGIAKNEKPHFRLHEINIKSWANYPKSLLAVADRLRGVVIEHMDAIKLINKYDRPDALMYIDPLTQPINILCLMKNTRS